MRRLRVRLPRRRSLQRLISLWRRTQTGAVSRIIQKDVPAAAGAFFLFCGALPQRKSAMRNRGLSRWRPTSRKWEVGSQNRLAPIRSLALLGLPSCDGRSYSASSKERLSSLHVPYSGMCNDPYKLDGFGTSDFRLMTSDWMRSIPTNPPFPFSLQK